MYKEHSRTLGRDIAAERLPAPLYRQLQSFRKKILDTFGDVLDRNHLAEEFDRCFWSDNRVIDEWLALNADERGRKIRHFEHVIKQELRRHQKLEAAEAELRSLEAKNEDAVARATGAPRLAEDADGVEVAGFFVRNDRPNLRGQCPKFRPCPYVSCRYHLYLDVTRRGRLRLNFPTTDVLKMPISCALDIAAEGPKTLEQIGAIMGGISRERVRQIEQAALNALRLRGGSTLVDFLSERAAEVEAASAEHAAIEAED